MKTEGNTLGIRRISLLVTGFFAALLFPLHDQSIAVDWARGDPGDRRPRCNRRIASNLSEPRRPGERRERVNITSRAPKCHGRFLMDCCQNAGPERRRL